MFWMAHNVLVQMCRKKIIKDFVPLFINLYCCICDTIIITYALHMYVPAFLVWRSAESKKGKGVDGKEGTQSNKSWTFVLMCPDLITTLKL